MAQPLRKLIPARVYLLLLFEALLVAGSNLLVTFIAMGSDAPLFLEYEGGELRIAVVAITYMVAAYLFNFYKRDQTISRVVLALQISQLIGIILLVQSLLAFVDPSLVLPSVLVISSSAVTLVVLIVWRIFLRPAVWNLFGAQDLLFVGHGGAIEFLANSFRTNASLGTNVTGHVVEPGTEVPSDWTILGSFKDLPAIVRQVQPDRIIVGASGISHRSLLKVLADFKAAGMLVESEGQAYESISGRVYSFGIEPFTVIFRNDLAAPASAIALQSLYTNLLALIGILIALPLIILIGFLLMIARRGGVLSTTACRGLHGIPFNMYRFRISDDWCSRLLVRYRLDGLPQMVNVIRGEMALIGPRADRLEFDRILTDCIPFYRQKYYVKPGLIGWSQLHCNTAPWEDTLERLEYDLYYIKHMSLTLDAYILVLVLKGFLLDRDDPATMLQMRESPVSD